MKTSTAALAALLAAAIGTAAIVPATFAQSSTDSATVTPAHFNGMRMHMMEGGNGPGMMRDGDGLGLINLVCAPGGAEALEIAFVHISHRLTLTDAQKPLFDALRTTALTAQTSYADTCAAAMPADGTGPATNLVDRVKTRIAIDTARLEALNAVLPDLEAFYESLTDEQRADLVPDRGERWMMQRELRDMGPGRTERGDAPGRMERAPAPGR